MYSVVDPFWTSAVQSMVSSRADVARNYSIKYGLASSNGPCNGYTLLSAFVSGVSR